MATNQPTKKRLLVETLDSTELQYWCKRFNCTKKRLLDAIAAVGNKAEDVENHVKGLAYDGPAPIL